MKQPELGQKIQELRKQKGLTQEELVDLCNINVRTIQRIEAGDVTPRSYTLKSIFNVLDFDFNEMKTASEAENKNTTVVFPGVKNSRQAASFHTHLNIAWICGGIYFLTGFVEFAVDYARFYEEDLILGKGGYISMKFIILACYIYFMHGFYIVGKIFNEYLLKIAALVLIMINMVFYFYDMISLYHELFYIEYVVIVHSLFYGLAGLLFGFVLLRIAPSTGKLATVTGGLKIASSFFFVTIFLVWLGYLFLIPAVFLQIILLYKIRELVKKKYQE